VKPPKQAKQHCVVIIVAPAPSGYDVFVHASPLQIRVDEFYRGVDVAVLGPPRRNPAAKDTNWVRDRRQLEARKRDAAADEVILADDDGEVLLEGLVTNLFVVVETEDPGGGHQPRRHAAFTAPTTRCLPGLARQAVLDALDAEGIPWEERAPTASERTEWSEAFVTNAVKLARPVRTLRWPRGIPGKLEVEFGPCAGSGEKPRGDSEWKNEVKCELDASPGPVCQAVLRRLNASMASDVGPAR
jgi:branched-subunit amino acid aminotransferase/4-amino-4-deoxychorismate lyase